MRGLTLIALLVVVSSVATRHHRVYREEWVGVSRLWVWQHRHHLVRQKDGSYAWPQRR